MASWIPTVVVEVEAMSSCRRVAGSWIVGIAALGCAWASFSCNSGSDSANPGEELGNLGKVGLELQLANGSTLDAVSYVVTGPGSFRRSASISVRDSTRISTTIGGLPAADGYTISISAASGAHRLA